MERIELALTLWQPWAWCVAAAGKGVENRGWAPPKSMIGQHIAIHAGQRFDGAAAAALREEGQQLPERYVKGAVVAVVKLAAVVRERGELAPHQRRWWAGPVGWVLTETIELREPVACRGKQGLWRLDHATATAIMAQLCPPA